jgi:hypothetical protein
MPALAGERQTPCCKESIMTNTVTPGTPGPVSPTPPKGGMPKWLIIVLAILVVFILVCCGGFAACRWACVRGAQSLSDQVRAATQQARQAAEAQQRQAGVSVDNTGAGLAMPADFPTDIPVMSGYKVRAKVTPPGGKSSSISLTGTSTLKAVHDFYSSEMAKQGWKQASDSAEEDSFTLVYNKDNRSVMIMGTDGGKDLQLIYGSD